MSERENDERREWRDEDLLEWLLDDEARGAAPREALESQPEVGGRLRELEAFLGDCRQALSEEALADEEADSELVERILASTTREDLSWRGDLQLVGGFLRQRLRASLLLRVVAASLLLHVVALPVLAYYTLVVIPERRLLLDVRPGPSEVPYEEGEPEPEREVSEPAEDDFGGASLAGRLRRERLARSGRSDLAGLASPPYDTKVWHDSLELVLWCEELMDEQQQPDFDARRGRLLEFALEELRNQLATGGEDPLDPLDRLEASAWLRARTGGWGEPDAKLTTACEKLLKGGGILIGSAWEETYREADRAEAGR